MFHRRFTCLDLSFKEKLKNEPRFESDLDLNISLHKSEQHGNGYVMDSS